MKLKFIVWIIAVVLLSSFVIANNDTTHDGYLWYDDFAGSNRSQWSDTFGVNEYQLANATTSPLRTVFNATVAGAQGVYLDSQVVGMSNTTTSVQAYIKGATGGYGYQLMLSTNGGIGVGGSTIYFYLTYASGTTLEIQNDGVSIMFAKPSMLVNTEYKVCYETNGTNTTVYINDTFVNSTVHAHNNIGGRVDIGVRSDVANDWFGNFTIWQGGCLSPPSPPAPPSASNFSATATDEWSGSSLNISLWIDGTFYGTNTTVTSALLSNSTTLHNVTIGSTDYFNRTYANYNVSSNLAGSLHQAEVCFNATEKASGGAVSLNNITVVSTVRTASPFCYNLSAGTYNVKAQKTGWYSQNQSFVVTALQNNTQTIVNMSYANLTVSAKDGTTNASLTSCDTIINHINWTWWAGESQTGMTNASYYLVNGTYNVSINCPGYALTYGVANVTVSGNTNYTFTLYKTNSVSITILDEITGNPILSNITVRWTNNATTWENITDTSTLFVYNLTPSNYTILFYGSNYSTRTYTITVGNLTTQFLTAYMVSSTYSTIFTVKDKDTGDIQADVAFTLYKLVNSTWTTVESKYTDITGKVQIYYDPIGNYRFYLAKSGYEDLIFYLNPILFDTYDVFMERTSPLNYSVDYDDISIIYSPHSFNNNENTTFNFLISSPDGQLTSYGIKLTFPGGVKTASGVNAIGEQLSTIVNLSGATRWDRVQLEYNYTTTLAGTRTFTQYLSINTNATASENTWMANKDRTYGLGIFERVLIVTIIVIFAVGISTMVGQPLPGMVMGIFLFGFMVYIGFIPIWSVLPSIIIGVLFLVWKSGG